MFEFAIIGCGRMGHEHTQSLQADGRGRVAALFDVHRPTAERLQSELAAGADVYDDLEALLDDVALDAVIVCSPTSAHFDQVRACSRRSLPVLCEKPLADTRGRIETLVENAADGAPVLSVAYQRRYWSTYRTMRREIQAERWGSIRAVAGHICEDWQSTITGTWRDDPEQNLGGFIGDAGSHKIDIVFFVTGRKPVEVFARCDRCGSQVEIVGTVCGRLEGDVPLSMSFFGHAHHLGEDLHVTCEKADLLIRDDRLWIAKNDRVEPFPEADLEPCSNPVSGFLDVLEGRQSNTAPPECALPVFDFTRGILDSCRTNRPVHL